MLDAALDLDVIERRGSWYAYKGKQLAQGRHNAVEYLKENEIGEQIQEDVRLALANYGKDAAVEEDEILADEVDVPIMAETESYLE